ncbi:MAG: HAD-IIA family hydrolase [Lachnospiraceae bacterium]|nr:HAD-IIA family hydrolase [Lachnospiraceae bacterium]
MPQILKNIDCYALDMDGTIYLGDQWIDGALDFLKALKKQGKQYVFLTNNSSKNADVYVTKLTKMGFPVKKSEIVTSGQATINYLHREYPGKKVFLLGNEMLIAEFLEAGIKLTDEAPEVVVVGFDTSLGYAKMCKVCDFVRAGLPYISTHPDFNCPTETGFIPDAGAIHAFIHASSFRYPDYIVGKPNGEIMNYMLKRTGACRERTAMVGDRLYTDVYAGVNNGFTGILVLSGEATRQDADKSEIKPHFIFPSLKEMISEI